MSDANPEVDVVIAVHTRERPIRRAVASVLMHTAADVRVTVVAHGLDPDAVRHDLRDFHDDARLRVVPFDDGIRSPAGPMNYGLELATGEFVSLLGSDDEFASGAIDAWLAAQRKYKASVVIARVDMVGAATQPHPPVRLFHRGVCDPAKDRLAYRTAPLGLVSRRDFGELRFTEGLATGEDLSYSLRLWYSGRRIVFESSYMQGYLGHSDATDRVTAVPRKLHEQLAAVERILQENELAQLSAISREAIVVKLLRVQICGTLAVREQLADDEAEFLTALLSRMRALAPRSQGILSITESRLLEQALTGSGLKDAGLAWARKFRFRSVMTVNPLRVFHAQAPLRFGVASLLVGRQGRR